MGIYITIFLASFVFLVIASIIARTLGRIQAQAYAVGALEAIEIIEREIQNHHLTVDILINEKASCREIKYRSTEDDQMEYSCRELV